LNRKSFQWLHCAGALWNAMKSSENTVPWTEQTPAWQTPIPEQPVPSGTGLCDTPVIGSHASAVHGLRSVTSGGAPGRQAPTPLHVSSPLHTVPSGHEVPAVAFVPGWHLPAPSQVSAPLHVFPSSHDEPLGVGVFWQNAAAPVFTQRSAVHVLLSLHGGGTEGVCAASTPSPVTKPCGPKLIVLAHAAPVRLVRLPVVSLPVTSRWARTWVLSPSVTAPPTSMRILAAVIGLSAWAEGRMNAPMPVVTPPDTRITTGSEGSSRAPSARFNRVTS